MTLPGKHGGLRAGSRLAHFKILELLGAGGIGQVYRARDQRLQREVAIKILHREHSDRPEYRSRFEREARAVARLSHPNILRLFDVGAENGTLFAVTELLEGETLRQRLNRSALSLKELLEIGRGVARGLGAAHAQGIVHRDLKPENFFLTRDNRVKILDFGLATYRETEEPRPFSSGDLSGLSAVQTRTGEIIGTAGYLSPEQARGLRVDERSDIFALGSVLYEMAAQARAFDGRTALDTLLAIVRDEVDPLPAGVPRQLAWVIGTCLHKDPSERFQSARDVALCLTAPMAAGIPTTTALGEAGRGKVAGFSGRGLGALGALGLALLAGAWWSSSSPPPEPLTVRYLSYGGQDRTPAASPDGRLIAFSSNRDGSPRLWIKQLASGNESPLTQGPDEHPRFSPDGGQVLFSRSEGLSSSLYRVSTLGGEPRKLLENASSGDFSPDGRSLAFVRLLSEGGRDRSVVGLAAADGGGARTLAVLPDQTVTAPRWSPDGRRIAVAESGHSNRLAFFLIRVRDGSVERIDPPPSTGFLSPPTWSEDGRSLLYAASENLTARQGGGGRVERLRLASARRQTVLHLPTAIESLARLPGGRLVLEVTAPSTDLAEVAGGGTEQAPRWLTRGPSTDRQPIYSADGEWIVFSSNRSGNLDLWRISTRKGTLQRLTDDPADDWDPAILGDGRIVWSSNRSGNFEIWIAGPDGSAPQLLSSDGVLAENPSPSLDGRWVVYNSRDSENPGLWRISPQGGAAELLVPGTTRLPEVSPDGSHVLFLSRIRLDRLSFRVADLETGRVLPFELETAAAGGRARWLPDSSGFAFTAPTAAGSLGIFRQSFDPRSSREPEAAVPMVVLGADASVESFALSPDGRRIAIAQRRPQLSSLVLAEPAAAGPP